MVSIAGHAGLTLHVRKTDTCILTMNDHSLQMTAVSCSYTSVILNGH